MKTISLTERMTKMVNIGFQKLVMSLEALDQDGEAPMASAYIWEGSPSDSSSTKELVSLRYYAASNSEESTEMFFRDLNEPGILGGGAVIDGYNLRTRSQQRLDALHLLIKVSDADFYIRFVLPYQHNGSDVEFPSAMQAAVHGTPPEGLDVMSIMKRLPVKTHLSIKNQLPRSLDIIAGNHEFQGSNTPPQSDGLDPSDVDTRRAMIIASTFFLVAAADLVVDKKELMSFQDQLIKVSSSDHPLKPFALAAMSHGYLTDPRLMALTAKLPPSRHLDLIEKELKALMRLSNSPMYEERLALYELAENIAKASGGWIFKVSKEERTALNDLKLVLDLPT